MKPGLIRSGPPPLTGLAFWLAAVFLVLVWGTAFTMVDVAVRYLSPIWVVALRTSLAAILVLAYAFYKGHRLPQITDVRWRWYTFLAVMGMVLPFFLIAWAQETLESGLSAILVGIMPLMTLVLAHFFTAEKMNARKITGFIIGFIGTVILFLPEDFSWGLVTDWRAQCLTLMAALGYAITTVAAKRAPETPSSLGAAMMVSAAAIISLAMAMASGVPSFDVPPITWLMIAGLAIGSTGIATIVYLLVIYRNGPTTLAKINYFPPFASVIAGIFFLNETFTLRTAIAFATIMLGVWIARNKRAIIPH